MKYDVNHFIKKFKSIPSRDIIVGSQSDGNGRHCAYGWCMLPEDRDSRHSGNSSGHETEEGIALTKLFGLLRDCHHWYSGPTGRYTSPAAVNNGNIKQYPQETPKKRILAALEDIKKLQHRKN